MSRIGKKTITLPKGTSVQVSSANEITVKGPKGELKRKIDRDLKLVVDANEINIERPTNQIRHRALHGLTRALLQNMVNGVSNGYKKQLELVGVGYKAASQGQLLDLALGYSHNIIFEVPKELKVSTFQEKGSNPMIVLEGIDNELLGQVSAKLRSLRKPEPYKGKGVKYVGEYIRRKAGKAAGGAKS